MSKPGKAGNQGKQRVRALVTHIPAWIQVEFKLYIQLLQAEFFPAERNDSVTIPASIPTPA
jgi:hypothetical protein